MSKFEPGALSAAPYKSDELACGCVIVFAYLSALAFPVVGIAFSVYLIACGSRHGPAVLVLSLCRLVFWAIASGVIVVLA